MEQGKESNTTQVFKLSEMINYQASSVVSRTLIDKKQEPSHYLLSVKGRD